MKNYKEILEELKSTVANSQPNIKFHETMQLLQELEQTLTRMENEIETLFVDPIEPQEEKQTTNVDPIEPKPKRAGRSKK
jgi:hypothetical protein